MSVVGFGVLDIVSVVVTGFGLSDVVAVGFVVEVEGDVPGDLVSKSSVGVFNEAAGEEPSQTVTF